MFPRKVRDAIGKIQYEYLSRMIREGNMLFMNYGWADLYPEAEKILLNDNDEKNRYCIQLYHRVCGTVDFKDKDVLEVGSGRGGGASYIMRYLLPKSMTGVDIAANAIHFCKITHLILLSISNPLIAMLRWRNF